MYVPGGVFFLDFSEIDLKDEKDSTLEQSGSASFDGSVFFLCAACKGCRRSPSGRKDKIHSFKSIAKTFIKLRNNANKLINAGRVRSQSCFKTDPVGLLAGLLFLSLFSNL